MLVDGRSGQKKSHLFQDSLLFGWFNELFIQIVVCDSITTYVNYSGCNSSDGDKKMFLCPHVYTCKVRANKVCEKLFRSKSFYCLASIA